MKQNSVAIVTGASQGIGRADAAGTEPLSMALDIGRLESQEKPSPVRRWRMYGTAGLGISRNCV